MKSTKSWALLTENYRASHALHTVTGLTGINYYALPVTNCKYHAHVWYNFLDLSKCNKYIGT